MPRQQHWPRCDTGFLWKPRPPQGYQGPLCNDFNLFPSQRRIQS
jgi:hypothetical protein